MDHDQRHDGSSRCPSRQAYTGPRRPAAGQLGALRRSFDRSLRALKRSERTREQYLMSVGQMVDFFARVGMPGDPAQITREHVETFLADFAEGHKPATVHTRYKCLRLFFTFLAEEGEITRHPMVHMRPPVIPETPVPVLSAEDLDRLLRTVAGRDFASLRDNAIIRLFVDTGMRRGDLSGLRVEDIDFDQDVAYVIGKGSRPRACPFGAKTG
ncbi:MAG: tyrosine-type recombinase/integrase, partial [Trebonia sp.]